MEKTATRQIRMSVVLDDLSTLVDVCSQSGWSIEDTGERVTTEEGFDGEAVVVIAVPQTRKRAVAPPTLCV